MTSWSLRDLTADDLSWMAATDREIFGTQAWSESLIRQDFASGLTRYRGAYTADTLVAYAVYGFASDVFSLLNVAVIPQFRGQGCGRALVEDFLREAQDLRQPEAWLEVAVSNHAAIGLYRSFGFEQVRVRKRYYQPEGEDALVMRVSLDRDVPTTL